jgi:hypothetical protein
LASSACAFSGACGARFTVSPKATFSSTVVQGKSAYSWKTMARSGPGFSTGFPKARTIPAEGATKPATMLSRVDFPQARGPSRQTNSPAATSLSCSASTPPPKSLRTPRISSAKVEVTWR